MAQIIQFPRRGVYARHHVPPMAGRPVATSAHAGATPSPGSSERAETVQRDQSATIVVRLMLPHRVSAE